MRLVRARCSGLYLGKYSALGGLTSRRTVDQYENRLGDAGFRHLLLYTSLFVPVGNNCYMQLSGRPIYDLYQHDRPVIKGRKRKRGGSMKQRSCNRSRRMEELGSDDGVLNEKPNSGKQR